MGVGELIKKRQLRYRVSGAQCEQVFRECSGITADVEDPVEACGKVHGCVVQPGPGGVDKQRAKIELIERLM